MEKVRIELLPRVRFICAFPKASLDYSRTPWVQVANLFGSIVSGAGTTMPILISSRSKAVEVFVHDGEWKRLEAIKVEELDPDEVTSQVILMTAEIGWTD